ncbi:MAG: thiolase family protein [bacterium]
MFASSKRIVLCSGARTPIGHLAKGLTKFLPEELLQIAIDGIVHKTNLPVDLVDGVISGWVGQGSHAPNIARIAVLRSHLPEKAHAFTVQANCVSSLESISAAVRHILTGEGELYIAGGTESMSNFPYTIRGDRSLKELRSINTLKENLAAIDTNPNISLIDCMEEGLNDPVKNINMAASAELCAQAFNISREEQDAYAVETYKRALDAENNGFYKDHIIPITDERAGITDKDEYPYLREKLVQKPAMMAKAPVLFDGPSFSIKQFYKLWGHLLKDKKYEEGKSKGTVTLFNSCARSDGAAVVIVTTYEKAKELKLEILGEIRSWAYVGQDPAYMGIGPLHATQLALKRAQIKFEQLDQIEIHEAFASTVLSVFKLGRKNHRMDWEKYWQEGRLNPHGGSIALGHPLAASGTRVVLNLLYALKKNKNAKLGLATACAGGGLGGAIIIEKIT